MAARDFVGRADVVDRVLGLALGLPGSETRDSAAPGAENAQWGLCLTGPSGSGKSALLAHVLWRLAGGGGAATGRERAPLPADGEPLVLAHFSGATPRSPSVDGLLLGWCDELAESLGEASPLTEGAATEQLEEAFGEVRVQGRHAHREYAARLEVPQEVAQEVGATPVEAEGVHAEDGVEVAVGERQPQSTGPRRQPSLQTG
jgi:hypothetical protein